MTRYTLKPKLPMRALVMAIFLAFVGASLLVTNTKQPLHIALVVMGAVALVIAVVFAIGIVVSMRTLAVHVDIDDKGYAILGAGEPRRGTWDEVTNLSTTPDGSRLKISKGMIVRHYVLAPGGAPDEQMAALVDDMRAKLQARGRVIPG